MPTPIGHALGGLAIAWFSQAIRGAREHRTAQRHAVLAAACATAAVAPDVDILFHSHRTYAHSVGAVILVGVGVWLIARARLKSRPTFTALTIAAAYSTHLLLDWLGKDTSPPFGLMALWPFSPRFYLSGANLFLEISRRYWKPSEFIVGNMKAVAWEVLVIGPITAVAWWLARRRLRTVRL